MLPPIMFLYLKTIISLCASDILDTGYLLIGGEDSDRYANMFLFLRVNALEPTLRTLNRPAADKSIPGLETCDIVTFTCEFPLGEAIELISSKIKLKAKIQAR